MKEILIIIALFIAMAMSCEKKSNKDLLVEEKETAISSIEKTSESDLLWSGDATDGERVFRNIEFQKLDERPITPPHNGSYFQSESDTEEGTVWHVHKSVLDGRVEARGAKGVTITAGNTYYIGFRFKLGQTPTSGAGVYHTVFQWKAYGKPMIQNIPLDVTYEGGHMSFNYRGPEAETQMTKLFRTPNVEVNRWYSVVLKIKTNKDTTGNVQIWWDSSFTPATLLTGETSFDCKTFDGSEIDPKWGYYNRKDNDAHIYFSQLRMGKTYESVNPIN